MIRNRLYENGTYWNKTVLGTDSSETLRANTLWLDDRLFGGGGNDTLIADSDYALLVGGAGNDDIRGSDHGDDIYGDNPPVDDVFWDGANITVSNSPGNDDHIVGGWGNDAIDGGRGNDVIYGGFEKPVAVQAGLREHRQELLVALGELLRIAIDAHDQVGAKAGVESRVDPARGVAGLPARADAQLDDELPRPGPRRQDRPLPVDAKVRLAGERLADERRQRARQRQQRRDDQHARRRGPAWSEPWSWPKVRPRV